jgi:hypothetical protein
MHAKAVKVASLAFAAVEETVVDAVEAVESGSGSDIALPRL